MSLCEGEGNNLFAQKKGKRRKKREENRQKANLSFRLWRERASILGKSRHQGGRREGGKEEEDSLAARKSQLG